MRILRDMIARLLAWTLPVVFLAVFFAFLLRHYYLDPKLVKHLRKQNAPLVSDFHPRPEPHHQKDREPASHEEAEKPAPVAKAELPPPPVEFSGDGVDVVPPSGTFAEILARTRKGTSVSSAFRFAAIKAPTKADKDLLVKMFYESKKMLQAWLQSHKAELNEQTAQLMATRMSEVGMKLPPVDFEPDLQMRSFVAFTRDESGAATVAVGNGFLGILKKDPKRAQFEMTRVMAQAWAPCEIGQGGDHPWKAVTKCLGVSEQDSCESGAYSDGGWAVSSTIATYLHSPVCKLAAFKEPEVVKCLASIPLPLKMTKQRLPASLWRPQ